MTRLLTSTLFLGALAASLVGAVPTFAAEATPKSVAVRPSGRLVAPEIVITAIRERPAPVVNVSAKREKTDDVVAANDRPTKS